MCKRLTALLITLVIAIGFAFMISYGAKKLPDGDIKDIHMKIYPSEKPVFEGQNTLVYDIPAEDDEKGHKELAMTLYEIACNYYENAEQVASFVRYTTTTMNIPANGFRHTIRKGKEYMGTDLCFVEDDGGIGKFLMDLMAKDSTQFAERVYYNSENMDSLAREKVIDPTPTFSLDGEKNMHYNVDWTNSKTSTSTPPNFSQLTDQNILNETLLSAKVSYNSEEGFYRLELELDTDNPKTTEKTLPSLRNGFGNDSAKYTSMVETIEIWDNGRVKYFLSEDGWEGKNIVTIKALLRYETFFYYDDVSCDPTNYQFISEYRDSFLAE